MLLLIGGCVFSSCTSKKVTAPSFGCPESGIRVFTTHTHGPYYDKLAIFIQVAGKDSFQIDDFDNIALFDLKDMPILWRKFSSTRIDYLDTVGFGDGRDSAALSRTPLAIYINPNRYTPAEYEKILQCLQSQLALWKAELPHARPLLLVYGYKQDLHLVLEGNKHTKMHINPTGLMRIQFAEADSLLKARYDKTRSYSSATHLHGDTLWVYEETDWKMFQELQFRTTSGILLSDALHLARISREALLTRFPND